MKGHALAENYPMAGLARCLGMTADGVDANVATWTLEAPRREAA